ncbi:hypothetical protein, partial [Streptomyces milbemycinicus]|uniref:hypothetical protein n=1 Tax=Streptomyces milbemycinicus TaxID=476552 RepID=UPI001B801498
MARHVSHAGDQPKESRSGGGWRVVAPRGEPRGGCGDTHSQCVCGARGPVPADEVHDGRGAGEG